VTEYCAVIGTHSTVRGDKLLNGLIPDPFPRCGIGSGHARLCDTMVYNSSIFRGLTNLYLSHCIGVSLAQLLLSATDLPYSHTDTHLPPLPPTHSQNKLSVLMTLIKKSILYQEIPQH